MFCTVECKPSIRGRRASIPGGVLSPRMVTKAFRRYADRAGLTEITPRGFSVRICRAVFLSFFMFVSSRGLASTYASAIDLLTKKG